jgi:hypothetical protein
MAGDKEKPKRLLDLIDTEGITPEAYSRLKDAKRIEGGMFPAGENVAQAVDDFLEINRKSNVGPPPEFKILDEGDGGEID